MSAGNVTLMSGKPPSRHGIRGEFPEKGLRISWGVISVGTVTLTLRPEFTEPDRPGKNNRILIDNRRIETAEVQLTNQSYRQSGSLCGPRLTLSTYNLTKLWAL